MSTTTSTDRIQKEIELRAPVARVWRALTDHREFNQWFRVNLESPFEVGKATRGRITCAGYEWMTMEVVVKEITPERRFAYTWHPCAIEPDKDYSHETPTLVAFTLEPSRGGGTVLTVTESGFDSLPVERRDQALRMNTEGWAEELTFIRAHVDG